MDARPAGRSICGGWAADILGNMIPDLVRKSLLFSSLDAEALRRHVLSCEDQVRGQPVPPSVQAMRDGMPPRLVGAVA